MINRIYAFMIAFLEKIRLRLIILRYKFWIHRDKQSTDYLKQLRIMSIEDTVNYIVQNKCSCTRYGDGEFLVMSGRGNKFQKRNESLAKRLIEVFQNQNDKLLICMPSFLTDVSPFVINSQLTGLGFTHSYLKSSIIPFVPTNILYGDSLFTRFYMNQRNKKKVKYFIPLLKKLWNKENLLIVEGKYSRLGVGNNLFDNAKSIKRILCPQENAFDSYDKIQESVLTHYHGELVILAIGMTATVLAYDLTKQGIRTLDLGHIDVEFEWYLMGAKTKVPILGKQMSEVSNGKCTSSSSNERYLSQILYDCSN